MTAAERITVDTVEAEAIAFDARDRAVVAGQVVLDFTQTGVLVALLSPREWEEVAAYLFALVEREPLKSGQAYVGHRTVLGSIAGELREYANLAGVETGLEADLRAATSKAEERRVRERITAQDLALERRMDDLAIQQAIQHRHEPEEPTEPESAAPESTDADLAYL